MKKTHPCKDKQPPTEMDSTLFNDMMAKTMFGIYCSELLRGLESRGRRITIDMLLSVTYHQLVSQLS